MPRHNPMNKQGYQNAIDFIDYCKEKGLMLDQKAIKDTVSSVQFRALHLFFKWLAEALNEAGIDFQYHDLINEVPVSIMYTKELVKERIWKPIQKTMFDIDSTKDLETRMINDILDVLTLWFAERGIPIKFPNKIDMWIERMNN